MSSMSNLSPAGNSSGVGAATSHTVSPVSVAKDSTAKSRGKRPVSPITIVDVDEPAFTDLATKKPSKRVSVKKEIK